MLRLEQNPTPYVNSPCDSFPASLRVPLSTTRTFPFAAQYWWWWRVWAIACGPEPLLRALAAPDLGGSSPASAWGGGVNIRCALRTDNRRDGDAGGCGGGRDGGGDGAGAGYGWGDKTGNGDSDGGGDSDEDHGGDDDDNGDRLSRNRELKSMLLASDTETK